jgi:hypothetical protein
MVAIEQKRRSFLLGLGSIGISQLFAQGVPPAQAAARQGYVLGPTEGEHLVHFRDHGNIYIKAGYATGSDDLALGTQQVVLGRAFRSTGISGWTKPSSSWKAAEL